MQPYKMWTKIQDALRWVTEVNQSLKMSEMKLWSSVSPMEMQRIMYKSVWLGRDEVIWTDWYEVKSKSDIKRHMNEAAFVCSTEPLCVIMSTWIRLTWSMSSTPLHLECAGNLPTCYHCQYIVILGDQLVEWAETVHQCWWHIHPSLWSHDDLFLLFSHIKYSSSGLMSHYIDEIWRIILFMPGLQLACLCCMLM